MKRMALLACLAGMAVAQSAVAQSADREGMWETRLGLAFQNSADVDFEGGTTAELESGTGFRLGFGYHYTDNIEFGVNFGFDQVDYEAAVAGDDPGEFLGVKGELEYTSMMFDATWNMLSGPFSPFVVGALGWTWVDTNIATELPQTGCWWDPWWGYVCTSWQDTKTIDGLSYQLGVGARYDFSDTFAVHGSYRMTWVDFGNAEGTPDFDGFELSIGWKF